MTQIKGPAIFLAQFTSEEKPFNDLKSICLWAASLGYKGVQIPTWDARLFDLKRAAESQDYCDEIAGIVANAGLQITELSTHLQGQMVAVHPAYTKMFNGFGPDALHDNASAQMAWLLSSSSTPPERVKGWG